ncbi:MAG: type II secretion system minor pseudopilin GspK [Nitrospirota bacterium]
MPNEKYRIDEFKVMNSQKGMALILTLMVLVIITAMVIEFSYAVYTSTNSLYNWQTSQRLSFVAKSGLKIASKAITENNRLYNYIYPGSLDFSFDRLFGNSGEEISIRIEDENSKFNMNSLVYQNGRLNEKAHDFFVRLLKILNLNPDIADMIIDWIDRDSEPRLSDSENASKNAYLDSVDEILLIQGIDRGSYDKLLPFITIYGDGKININGAGIPVLMSLSDSIDRGMAERIVKYRESVPFKDWSDIYKVAGFTLTVVGPFETYITTRGTAFHVIATATSEGIKRSIESVLEISGDTAFARYWKEI